MICEACKADGKTSTIDRDPYCRVTAMASHSFWDQGGELHVHDRNVTTQVHRCSNGHKITVRSTPSCPAPGCDVRGFYEVSVE